MKTSEVKKQFTLNFLILNFICNLKKIIAAVNKSLQTYKKMINL